MERPLNAKGGDDEWGGGRLVGIKLHYPGTRVVHYSIQQTQSRVCKALHPISIL